MSDIAELNARTLDAELDWFERVLDARLMSYFEQRDWRLDDLPPAEGEQLLGQRRRALGGGLNLLDLGAQDIV